MNGLFIAPFIYAELFRPWLKFPAFTGLHSLEFSSAFAKSKYTHALATLDLARTLGRERLCDAADLCIGVHFQDLKNQQEELRQFRAQGAKILLLTSEVKEASQQSGRNDFDEVVLYLKKVLGKSDIAKLSTVSNLKFLFSYEINQLEVAQTLKLFAERNLVSAYLELWPKADMEAWFLPRYQCLHLSTTSLVDGHSVVIPFQENLSELKTTLKSLFESLKEQENFEIVLVDDGYGSDSWQEIAAFFPEHQNYFSYVKLERKAARVRGDASFRAGVARNVGAIHSRGHELVFLDSDILLGTGFWQALREARKNHSGPLMPRRRQLLSSVQTDNKTHKDFHPFEDTQLSFGGHWEQFYREWPTENNAWKWTSTYCLCLGRQAFMSVGGFHRSFYCYGFEDTELGYKLSKLDQRLQIADADVYHLPVQQGRSEYQGELNQRKQILAQSFQVLLRATLDIKLIELFQHVISK